jgi:hypothetical protein
MEILAIHVLRLLRKHRQRAIVSEFSSLVETPHNFASPLQLPARAKLFVKLGATVASNTVICTVNGASKQIGPTTAGVYRPLGYFEARETLTAVYAGSMDIYIQDSVGKLYRVATKA